MQYRKILCQKLILSIIYDSNDLTIKNKKDEKLYIEDEKTSQSYTMEAVAYFNVLNFDDLNIDEFEIDYIEESI